MERWILGADLIKNNIFSEVNLVSAVKSGELIPYKINDDEPYIIDEMKKEFELYRVEVMEDQNQGNIYDKLSEKDYNILIAGWGNHLIANLVWESKFKEEKVNEILDQGQSNRCQASETALLKLIGALIEIHYLDDKLSISKMTKTAKGKPIVAAIAKAIHQQIAKTNINIDNLREENLRKNIIPAALNLINFGIKGIKD